jgi:pimeloyl-ACP methyl ester carboxylesterase
MLDWKDAFIERENKRIHYYYHLKNSESGAKSPFPMIFCHGFMDNGLCYDRVAECFASAHDLYLIDARGHGKSSDPPKNATYLDLIADIFDVCTDNGLKDVIITGHSMGGVEAALFAAEHPELVKAVILEDPGFAPKISKFIGAFALIGIGLTYWHQDEPASLEKHIKRAKFMNRSWAERDQLVWAQAEREFRTHYPVQNLKILGSGAAAKDILPRIQAPVLLFTSQRGIVKKKAVTKFRLYLPSLQWVYVPNAGHNIRREQFELEINAITDFLRSLNL